MWNIAAEVTAHNTVPSRLITFIKLLFHKHRHITLKLKSVQGLYERKLESNDDATEQRRIRTLTVTSTAAFAISSGMSLPLITHLGWRCCWGVVEMEGETEACFDCVLGSTGFSVMTEFCSEVSTIVTRKDKWRVRREQFLLWPRRAEVRACAWVRFMVAIAVNEFERLKINLIKFKIRYSTLIFEIQYLNVNFMQFRF